MKVAFLLLFTVTFCTAAPAATTYHDGQPTVYNSQEAYQHPPIYNYYGGYDYAPTDYRFDYAVKDDYAYVDMGHNENRNGDRTHGQYFVALPDGRRLVVSYHVDGDSGYVADVKYQPEVPYY